MKTTEIHWIAHRGYPARYPENSLASFKAALEAGAEFIETDIQFSRDLQPFLHHDDSLNRLCHQSGCIFDHPAASLETLPVYFEDQLHHRGLAPLRDLLSLLIQYPRATLFLEVKAESLAFFGRAPVLAALLPIIQSFVSQVVVISFDLPLLSACKQAGYPRVAPVVREEIEITAPAVISLEAEAVFIHYQRINQWPKALSGNCPLMVYEVSDALLAGQLYERGVRFIETDAIGEMLADDHPWSY